jgi:hypothetical protein
MFTRVLQKQSRVIFNITNVQIGFFFNNLNVIIESVLQLELLKSFIQSLSLIYKW